MSAVYRLDAVSVFTGDSEKAFPVAMERIVGAVLKLPATDRTVETSHVWYAGDASYQLSTTTLTII